MKRILLFICLACFGGGCASSTPAPFPAVERAERGLTAEDLAAAVWTARPQTLRLRQTARFIFRGRELPMIGLMELDTRHRRARLIAVNDMGVKLFDLTVSDEEASENYMLPELKRYPLSEAVATSLRRIFFAPQPQPEKDALQESGGGYRLAGERSGRTVAFLFGGQPVRLVEKSAAGEGEDWRVVYLDYQTTAELDFPQDIVLEDRRAGYRLELRIGNVSKGDEQIAQ